MSNEKIMIFRIGSIGDTIVALPAFNRIRELYPINNILLLSNKPVVSKAAAIELILGNDFFFNSIINYPINTRNIAIIFRLIINIRKEKIDKLFYLTQSKSSKRIKRDLIFFWLAGVKQCLAIPKLMSDFEILLDPETNAYEWEAKRLARRLFELGHFNMHLDKYWDLHLTEKETNIAEDIYDQLPNSPINICIAPGTKMQSKDWGKENWKSLVLALQILYPNANVIVLGASEETNLGNEIIEGIANPSINLCGIITPRVSTVVLKKSNIFIGHDSGPMHLAAAAGTPVVAIFSSMNLPGQWYPRGKLNQIIYHDVDCAGCYLEICIVQKKKCILSISISEVLEAVKEILN